MTKCRLSCMTLSKKKGDTTASDFYAIINRVNATDLTLSFGGCCSASMSVTSLA